MAELKVEQWPIDKLIPYARNPRRNDEAVPKMASLIKEFGFKVPVVARSDGSVIDGHLRLKAARHLGMETVPVVLADEWTPAQVKAFRLAVNKSAEWAEWEEDLLALELEDLKAEDFDLGLIDFDNVAVDGPEGKQDEEELPPDDFNYEQKWAVIVECTSEAHQQQVYEKLMGEGYECKVVVN